MSSLYRSISHRKLDKRSLRKYRDARMIRSVCRFNDGVLQTLGEKLHSATEKAIAWCKEKKAEHPKLAKLLVILIKIRAFSLAVASGTSASLAVASKFSPAVKGGLELAGSGPLKAILLSIYGLLKSIAGFAVAKKVESL